MEESNLDFLEKVKSKNKRILINTFIRFFIVSLIVIFLSIYLFTPLSSVDNMVLHGNIFFSKDDICEILNYNNPKKKSLYSVNKNKTEELLKNYPFIDEAKVNVNPFQIEINLEENAPSCKYNDDIYSSKGNIISNELLNNSLAETYLNKALNKLAYFISTPIECDNFASYMKIISKVNSEEKHIDYVENKKNNLIIYYINSNLNYFRVDLKYNSDYSIDYYVNFLLRKDFKDNCILISNTQEVKKQTLNGHDIFYKDVIINEEGHIIGRF